MQKEISIQKLPTTAPQVLTVKLRNGLVVLAKKTKYSDADAFTYCNDTQAEKKADQLRAQGIDCYVWGYGRPAKFIAIKNLNS